MTGAREYPDRPAVGVGGVVISNGRVLLVRRGHAPSEGEWSIPGGLLEVGETLVEGVRRELQEETGIRVKVFDVIDVFERISMDGEGKTKFHFVVLDYFCESGGGDARPGSDVTEVAWVAEKEVEGFSLTAAVKQVIGKAFQIARSRR